MTVTIRRLRNDAADMQALLKWLTDDRVLAHVYDEDAPWNLDKVIDCFAENALPDSKTAGWIIHADNLPVGYMQHYPVTPESYRFTARLPYARLEGAYGTDMFIGEPELWRKGIGRKAVDLLAEHLRSLGVTQLCADPAADNEHGMAFWPKVGFVPIGTVPEYDHPDKESMLMLRVLIPAGRSYYEAYDDRYRQVHAEGLLWFTSHPSPIVREVMQRYHITPDRYLLELGCGEGRDAFPLLTDGFNLLATDVAPEAIRFCQEKRPVFSDRFRVLDCVKGTLAERFDFIFAVAVLHMLVPDEDRDGLYRFILEHLKDNGIALICTMGDGECERQSDVAAAFDLQERRCAGRNVRVAGTSCRMVSRSTFEEELQRNNLMILEIGQTCIPEEFAEMMYAVVRRA